MVRIRMVKRAPRKGFDFGTRVVYIEGNPIGSYDQFAEDNSASSVREVLQALAARSVIEFEDESRLE